MFLATAVLLTLAFITVFLVVWPAVKIAQKVFSSPKQTSGPKKETQTQSEGQSEGIEQQLTKSQRRELEGLRNRVTDEYRIVGKVDINAYVEELKKKLSYMGLGDDFIDGMDRMKADSRSAHFRVGKDGSLRIFWNRSLLYQITTGEGGSRLRILPPDFKGVSDPVKARQTMANVMATGTAAEKGGARDVLNILEKVILCPDNISSIKKDLLPEVVKGDMEKPAIPKEVAEQTALVGITERFVQDDGSYPVIRSREISDILSKESGMTHLEANNRRLAGDRFKGFNLMVDDGSRMTLTYAGQAVASLTRFREEETKTVDGKEVKQEVSYYRTNTFPPRITDSLLPTDISTMLEAGARIRQVDDDPNLVWAVMKDIVTECGNVEKLRTELAPKIQAAESKHKAEELHPEEMGNAAAKKRQVHRS